ncbi:MAG: hypothetical protein ACTSYF_03400 [Promethearchaeota archaeon]
MSLSVDPSNPKIINDFIQALPEASPEQIETLEEELKKWGGVLKKVSSKIDTNSDGIITKKELYAFLKKFLKWLQGMLLTFIILCGIYSLMNYDTIYQMLVTKEWDPDWIYQNIFLTGIAGVIAKVKESMNTDKMRADALERQSEIDKKRNEIMILKIRAKHEIELYAREIAKTEEEFQKRVKDSLARLMIKDIEVKEHIINNQKKEIAALKSNEAIIPDTIEKEILN